MEKVICKRPHAKIKDHWKNEAGVILVGPAHNEEVTVTERSIVQGNEVLRLKEYKLPSNGWWKASNFKTIKSQKTH